MPHAPDLVFQSPRVVTPDGEIAAAVWVRNGLIERIAPHGDVPRGTPLVDAGDCALLPGLVDAHVHVNEPGRTDWEGFWTATRAAARGGVTTIVDMPLNSIPPTISVGAMRAKCVAAASQCWIDVALWGGVVPGNALELAPLYAEGVAGFKCFLVPSGVDEFPHVGPEHLRDVLPRLAKLGAPLLVHAELPEPIDAAGRALAQSHADRRAYATWLASRPPVSELAAVELLIELCRESHARIHVVHLACGDAVEPLRAARAEGLPISAETCPHYLTFDGAALPDGETAFKCAPPIRARSHGEALWRGLESGVIESLVSDHSPCSPELKCLDSGDYFSAWGGIASLQLGLAVAWTEAQTRGIELARVCQWMSAAPARLAGLSRRKGAIAPGLDADLVVFDPAARFEVRGEALEHRHKLTPYEGRTLRGVVRSTWLRGSLVQEFGQFVPAPRGALLRANVA